MLNKKNRKYTGYLRGCGAISKSKILSEIENVDKKTKKICHKIENFVQKRKFCQKNKKICQKIENFVKNRKFCQKSKILSKNENFVKKTKIF